MEQGPQVTAWWWKEPGDSRKVTAVRGSGLEEGWTG